MTSATTNPLKVAAAAGIHRIEVATPFLVGPVNCYLIEDEPLTLIDTGLNWMRAFDELEAGLREHNRSVADLERIVITHQHVDHLGLVSTLIERSGAELCTLDLLAPIISNFQTHARRDAALGQEIMSKYGVPPDAVRALSGSSNLFEVWGSSASPTLKLKDKSELEFAQRKFRVLHRPGHSPTDTVFIDEQRGIALVGDHLIENISSNPVIHSPAQGTVSDVFSARPRPLLAYIDSLKQTRELKFDIALAGHGEPVTNHVKLIDARFDLHRRRARQIRRLIATQPRTAYELAQQLWGDIALSQSFLTICEVLGHIDILLERNEVTQSTDDGVVYFEST